MLPSEEDAMGCQFFFNFFSVVELDELTKLNKIIFFGENYTFLFYLYTSFSLESLDKSVLCMEYIFDLRFT